MNDDLPVRVDALHLHPVKSCAGVEVAEALVIETGLELDRGWTVADAQGRCLTQRELPRLALVKPTVKTSEMVLRAPGMLALHVSLEAVEAPTRASLRGESFAAYDMGALSARWFSDFLGREVRLVRFDPEQHRRTGPAGAAGAEAAWHDAHALHVISLQALEALNRRLAEQGQAPISAARFRPNLVLDAPGLRHDLDDGADLGELDGLDELTLATPQGVVRLQLVAPCVRCPVVDVDPLTGVPGAAVLRVLADAAPAAPDGMVRFGSYAVVVEGIDCVLRPGLTGTARRRPAGGARRRAL